MRILLDSHGYPPTISGVSVVVHKLAHAMRGRGHEVTVTTASDTGEPYTVDDAGVEVIRLRSMHNPFWKEGPFSVATQGELAEIVTKRRPEIIHVHEAGLLALYLRNIAEEKHVPTVCTCHYVPSFAANYLSQNKEARGMVENVLWTYSVRVHNHYRHVVFPTHAHRAMFQTHGLTAPASVISNGVNMQRYYPRVDGAAADVAGHDLPKGPRILSVGRLARDKSIDVLINAMPLVLRDQPAHLLIVGRGDDRVRLGELAQNLGVEGSVHFMDFVPEADLPALYRACDLFAIASIYEVQSIPTLQALAAGLPVVAADALALPELIRDDFNGYLVTPNSPKDTARALLRILSDPDRARVMGRNALETAQPHAEQKTLLAYEDLYRQLV